jgi:hypothetical protein
MANNEINYEEENEKLCFFLKKQSKRIEKLRKKCTCPEEARKKTEEKTRKT